MYRSVYLKALVMVEIQRNATWALAPLNLIFGKISTPNPPSLLKLHPLSFLKDVKPPSFQRCTHVKFNIPKMTPQFETENTRVSKALDGWVLTCFGWTGQAFFQPFSTQPPVHPVGNLKIVLGCLGFVHVI